MTKKIRKLNNNGLKEFAAFLIDSHDELVSENNPPTQLLYDDQYSEDLNVIKNIISKSIVILLFKFFFINYSHSLNSGPFLLFFHPNKLFMKILGISDLIIFIFY